MSDGTVVDKNGNVVGRINSKGEIIDTDGKVVGHKGGERLVYDANGNVIGKVLADGTVVDMNGNVIGKVMPDGTVVDKDGNIIGYAESENLVYDDEGNIIGRLLPDGTVVNLSGGLLGHINANGEVVDENGNVIGTVDKANLVYDENGNVIGRVLPDGTVVDMYGNVIGKVLPDGTVVDLNGKVIGHANVSHLAFDEDGNVIGTIQADGTVVDKDGNVVGKVRSDGSIVDANGNIIGKVDASDLVYDENGNVIGRIMPDGTVVDLNGRVIGKVLADGTVVDMNGNVIGHRGRNKLLEPVDTSVGRKKVWFSRSREEREAAEIARAAGATGGSTSLPKVGVCPVSKGGTTSAPASKVGIYGKTLGIALTPDGEYLGEIMEDGTVVNKQGEVIGRRMPDGLIVDNEGTLIGIEEVSRPQTASGAAVDEMFVPQGTFGTGGAYGTGTGPGENLGAGGGFGPGERYDPQRAAALGAAQQVRRQGMHVGKISSNVDRSSFDGMQKDWSEQGISKTMSSWRVNMSEMILADKPIPAVIARSIDSNNPTPVTAFVERNVYAEEGRNVIIPAGSHLIGTLGGLTGSSETTSVSAKVSISWERLIRPDGSMFKFSGLTGDAQGRGGALGYLDQQLFKKYTLPIMTTALTSYASYIMADDDNKSGGETETPKQQAANDARENFLEDMKQIFQQILQDKANIKPLTYVPAGTRIIIYPNTDLWMRTEDRNPKGGADGNGDFKKGRPLINDKETAKERAADNARAQVMYNSSDSAAPAAASAGGSSGPKLINDNAPAASNNNSSGALPPPPPSSSSSGSSSSVPQLF